MRARGFLSPYSFRLYYSFREFKPREQTAEIVKIPETEEDTKKPVETRFDETENNGSQADNEDKFKRTKSTKSNKSLTLPLDPVKRKDSGASSRDFSTVTSLSEAKIIMS